MRRWITAGSLILLSVLVPHSALAQSPQVVQQWSGNGNRQTTEPFQVTGSDWTLTWTSQDRSSIPGYLSIAIYNADTRRLVGRVAGNIGGSGGTTTQRSGPGSFYLDIDGANTNWSVQASEIR
jgi:hypothetical protein